ncbi:MAG: phenylalanine--tRNA ligase subunit beta [Ignisphaera sp.]|nr:phenylalanine--tRNA ligase subunit beta [Ignisphaera sp.]
MPVVKVRLDTLARLTGVGNIEVLQNTLFNLKCESEIDEEGNIAIEVQSDRIDMFSAEGIAKAVRLYLGLDKPSSIELRGIPFKVIVKPPIKRPYIALAAVTNVNLDEEKLKLLIDFQERLHTTFGRNRRKVAIGLHDLDRLPSPLLEYRDVDVDQTCMIPLHDFREMSIRKVLEATEQGVLYGSIALNENMHPAILSEGKVISLPPVINSDITRLTESTRNILIDVTGTDVNAVNAVLNSIINALAFYGGEVLGAEIIYPETSIITPDLKPKVIKVDLKYIFEWLGIEREQVSHIEGALNRMGHRIISITEDSIEVEVPYYRNDILHQVDIAEDIAMGIGYENLGFEEVEPRLRIVKGLSLRALASVIREALIGLGYAELNTLTLVPNQILEELGFKNYVMVINAPSNEINALRSALLQSIIITLKNSQYIPQPVKVFEIGEVVTRCSTCYNKWKNELRVCWAIMNSETRFEEVHATLYAILKELELATMLRLRPCDIDMFSRGRCADVYINDTAIGVLGEINPEKLVKLGIFYPITLAEVSINILYSFLTGKNVK